MMDRENADREPADLTLVEPSRANAPSGVTVVSVCITCKTADGAIVVGPDMFESVKAAIGESSQNVQVRPVQCLSVCKRPATVAVSSSDGYTFLFGDLHTESATAALVSFVQSYQQSDYGLVPWRERAEVLRKGMVARVPPMHWSPDDGRAPK
jgi:predicted metal-binding protein